MHCIHLRKSDFHHPTGILRNEYMFCGTRLTKAQIICLSSKDEQEVTCKNCLKTIDYVDEPKMVLRDYNGEFEGQDIKLRHLQLAYVNKVLETENFSCEMFAYSCGEFTDLDGLTKHGCNRCKRFATMALRKQELVNLIGAN